MSLSLAFIEGIGGSELVMIMFIILLLFGSDKLPALAKGLGKTMREFKKAASGIETEVRRAMEEEPEEIQPHKFPPYQPPTGTIQQGGPDHLGATGGTPVPPESPPTLPPPSAAG